MLPALEVVAVLLITGYLCQWFVYCHLRERQSWIELTSQSTGTLWRRARVMMETCDFAERHGHPAESLAPVRQDAMQIRLSVLMSSR